MLITNRFHIHFSPKENSGGNTASPNKRNQDNTVKNLGDTNRSETLKTEYTEDIPAGGEQKKRIKQTFKGTRINGGVAIGDAYVFQKTLPNVSPDEISDTDEEFRKLSNAIARVIDELDELINARNTSISKEEAAIFEAHKLIISDPELVKEVRSAIASQHMSAAFVWRETISRYIALYKNAPGKLMAERAADVLDAGMRVLSHLTGIPIDRPDSDKPVVLITDELSPSDTAILNPDHIVGLICEKGSETSHSGILIKSLGIPAVFGVNDILGSVKNTDACILDGDNGMLYINPDSDQLELMQRRRDNWLKSQKMADAEKNSTVFTKTGERIHVLANVSEPKHVEQALGRGAEGIGLYRTEFLYMGRSQAPDEQEQYEVYRQAVELMNGKTVTFRTIDIGGDKPVGYLSIQKEENPFLGWRGIRFSLEQTEVFTTQLRALLRASAHGPLHIMFPMIAIPEEWRKSVSIVEQVKRDLQRENIPFDENIQLGIMVEVPSAAIRIQDFLEEVDFVSIGTNDLTQYIMAADRMNTRVAALASYHQPAVLDLIEMVIKACIQKDVPVSMCGEMARDTEVTERLLEMGLRSFSMSASGIPAFKLHLLSDDA